MDIEHPCGMLNCNHNIDFSCCDNREYLGCDYKTYANFYDKHIREVEINPYVIDEEEGETIIYAESPEEALRRFYYINGYIDKEEQEDFSAKLCKELKDVKRNNFYRMDLYNDNDRYELVKHLNYSCEERNEDCQKCVVRSMCKLWKTKESFS